MSATRCSDASVSSVLAVTSATVDALPGKGKQKADESAEGTVLQTDPKTQKPLQIFL